MKPARIFQRAVPVDVTRLGQSDGTVIAIVDDLRSPLVGASLKVIDTQAALAAHDSRSIHAEPAQLANHSVGDWILIGQDSNKSGGQAQLRDRDRHVGLTASKGGHELRSLQDLFKARRRQPQHDFPKSDGRLSHVPFS